jgi:ring-1,2-phenylacetyl-CoA epoxidase subunit PaaE
MSLNQTFHPLRVAEVRRETPDAVSVRFEVPAALAEAYRFEAGQHLTIRRDFDGEDVRRNYSVCVSPADGELRIAIKETPGGLFSRWANSELTEGTVLDVMPAIGRF